MLSSEELKRLLVIIEDLDPEELLWVREKAEDRLAEIEKIEADFLHAKLQKGAAAKAAAEKEKEDLGKVYEKIGKI